MTATLLVLAALLDWLLPAPRRWHPLAGFERLARWLERRLYRADRWRGAFLVTGLVLPPVLLAAELEAALATAGLPADWEAAFSGLVLYLTLGHRCLHERARAAATENRHEAACVIALNNGGVFGVLFWFLVAGAAGALLYRLAHNLKLLWDPEEPRDPAFGWAAAQLDDMLGVVPARLAALGYALFGATRQSLTCWREQAADWPDPNAGPLLASGAGALGIRLGGGEHPLLGMDAAPVAADGERALALVRKGVLLWLSLSVTGTLIWWWFGRFELDWNLILNTFLERLLA